MKRILAVLICCFLLTGCVSSNHVSENQIDNEVYLAEIEQEIYQKAYEEGYRAAIESIIDEMPWYIVDWEEIEESLDWIFDDEGYADEIRDQISSYCKIYERTEFDPRNSETDAD